MSITEHTKRRIHEIPVESIAQRLGMNVSRHKAVCPFHDDHHPSLTFSTRYNSYRCYACGAHGDGISLVQEKLGYDFVDACTWIANQFGIPMEGSSELPPVSEGEQKPPQTPQKEEFDMEVLKFIYDVCHDLCDDAKRFLFEERGYDKDVVKRLKIGSIWSSSGIAKLIVEKFGEERALKSGLVFKHGDFYRCYFNAPSLLFPYFGVQGKLQSVQARYIGTEDKPRFQFPKGKSVAMFNKPQLKGLREGSELYIAEGGTDCMALLSDGYNAIAIPSATTLKEADIKLLAKFNLKMYPDNDGPGQHLFEQIQSGIAPLGGHIERITLPAGFKDYSEYYRSKRNSRQ